MPSPHWSAPVAHAPVDATVPLPGSKSMTNRALVLAALAAGSTEGFRATTEINTVGSAVTLRAKVPHSLLSSFLPREPAPENL